MNIIDVTNRISKFDVELSLNDENGIFEKYINWEKRYGKLKKVNIE